jgi:hypothetical protein
MSMVLRCALLVLATLVSARVSAQDRSGVIGELVRDVTTAESKIIALAKAMPASVYDWRPAPGVRSTGEVFIHIAGDNYFLPALTGTAPPVSTGIDAKDATSVARFEARRLTPDKIIAELSASFAHLKGAISETPDGTLEERPRLSVRNITTREHWITTVTHLHEHLGQLIAYARMNNITPPWSK